MPSLRARASRPSYALMAEGLENLSDEDGSAEGAGPKAAKRSKGKGTGTSDDEDDDMSSGGSSAFKPAPKGDKGKGKSKGKGKGKGKNDDSGSEFAAGSGSDDDDDDDDTMDVDDEDDEKSGSEPPLRTIDDDDDDDLIPVKSPKPRPGPGRSNTRPGTGGSGNKSAAAYVQTEADIVPPAYRALVKKHADVLAGPLRAPAPEKLRDFRSRALDTDQLPFGPTTPYITRLKNAPRGRGPAEIVVDTRIGDEEYWEERKAKRQMYSVEYMRTVALFDPWQIWQGEGWWPEMASKSGSISALAHSSSSIPGSAGPAPPKADKGKGKASSKHSWQPRDEVDLGLHGVGRYDVDAMTLLDKECAAKYLPATRDINGNPHATVHMGMYGKQTPQQWKTFDGAPLDQYNPDVDGYVFSAGGPIWGLDWCPFPDSAAAQHEYAQYLAVSPMPHIDYKPAMGQKCPSDAPGCIQIWSVTRPLLDGIGSVVQAGGMRCELVLCLEGGPATSVKWMPLGAWDADGDRSALPKLGILAACQLDGSISFYAVPHPRRIARERGIRQLPLYLHTGEPLLKLSEPDSMITTFDWVNGGRVICGTSTGHVIAWDVLEALRSPNLGMPLPVLYVCLAQSYVQTIVVGRMPPNDANGDTDYSRDPIYAVVGAYDGTSTVVDLRDAAATYEIVATRMPVTAIGWSSQLGCPMWGDPDHVISLHHIKGTFVIKNFTYAFHRGPIWSISTSDYHTMAISASADGSVILANLNVGWFRRRGAGLTLQRLFEMDYDEHTGEYRMLDNFMPEDVSLDYAQQKNTARTKSAVNPLEGNPIVVKTGNWSPHVGIHRTCWNNNGGLGRAGWIASGTASGLGRIDILEGRFRKDRLPINL